ncbi:MAG TPA: hypothetical protein VM889_12140 [Candidatus Thermoplasmatota archaeon]|nr:hypothetical protein [Candidatus Thermoplasmatota archaeon]
MALPETSEVETYRRHLANLHTVRLVKERVSTERMPKLLALAPDEPAERTLQGIIMDALRQKDELEDILIQWRRMLPGAREHRDERPRAPNTGFREMLGSLAEVKRNAVLLYLQAAADCPNPALAERLRRLAAEDGEHALILDELLERAIL